MNFIMWIIIGGLAGWIAEKVTKSDHGLLKNIAVGIIGAFIGGWLASVIGIVPDGGFIGSLITAVAGAVILLFGLKAIRGKM
ncbi:MAG: GlsB/YeaQ/YmgE family stress response membrane protein [Alphaproteobacteria bacterium]